MTTRILLFVGKGGVGKTTVASATAFACASRGQRTLLMSLDAAHSLSDAFDLPKGLMDKNQGRPTPILDNLWLQEIDVQDALKDHWGEVYGYISMLFQSTGFDRIMAEELAILPGMEEVVGLLYINQYHREKTYDVIILDCAPTGESLRFLSMPSTLEWYMKKLFSLERNIVRLARPIARHLTDIPIPEDEMYQDIEQLFKRLSGVNELLLDPDHTTVRLVTNAEKMVVRETQRAFMYFCMYGLTVDAVVVNRLLTNEISDSYFDHWKQIQQAHTEDIYNYFSPVPVLKLGLYPDEMVGSQKLGILSDHLYHDLEPSDVLYRTQPYRFVMDDTGTRVILKLPFVSKQDVDLHRDEEQLIVRVGGFKRHIPLPRAFQSLQPTGAKFEGDELHVRFSG